MENTDEVRGRGGSRSLGEERTARYVVDIIPESAGPRKVITRGSVMHSVPGPGSQKFLAEEHSAGIVLVPARKLRASPGSDRIKEFDAPTGSPVINPAGVDSSPAWSATGENAVVSISPEALSDPAGHEFDVAEAEPAFELTGEDDRRHRRIPEQDMRWPYGQR